MLNGYPANLTQFYKDVSHFLLILFGNKTLPNQFKSEKLSQSALLPHEIYVQQFPKEPSYYSKGKEFE
jgi:hypothetical protein